MAYRKTFRTYKEQLEFMKERGIVIEDEKEALETLSTFSYYSLVNLNKHLYGGLHAREFKGHPTILDLQLAHMLNMDFYHTVLKGILYVESSFKTKLAYLISRKFGPVSREDIDDPRDNFLYRGHYDLDNNMTPGILRTLRNKFNYLHSPANINSYSHQFLSGGRTLPPWMFIHDIEFGLAISWYSILIEDDKKEICTKMISGETGSSQAPCSSSLSAEFLTAALDLLREYRNTIAHGERVFPSEMTGALPKEALFTLLPPGILSPAEYDQGIGKSDPFACLLSLVLFIHDPVLMLSYLTEIQTQLEFAGRIRDIMAPGALDSYKILGIPDFTLDRLLAVSHQRFGRLSRAYFNPGSHPGSS